MRQMLLMTALLTALAAPLGVAAQSHTDRPEPTRGRDCVDGTRQTTKLEVINDREAIVTVVPNRAYRITLAQACPPLLEADNASFANGPSRYIGHRSRGPVWATELRGNGRICGGAGDRLMLRDRFYDFDRPMKSCPIASVERLTR